MLKKDITYTDLFTDEEVTETFYFNLTKVELLELDGETPGGLQGQLKELENLADENGVISGPDMLKVLNVFKQVMRKAYLVRSEDGKRPIKNDEVWEAFASSTAFDVLIESFFTAPDQGAEFINAMMPKDLVAQVLADQQQNGASPSTASMATPEPGALAVPATGGHPDQPRHLSKEEVVAMDGDELRSGLAEGRYIIDNN